MQHVPHSKLGDSTPGLPLPAGLVVFLTGGLGLFGGILLFLGARTIHQRSYNLHWEATQAGQVGFLGIETGHTSGVVEYRGAEAVRAGVGFVALGAMLVDWCGLLLWSHARRRTGDGRGLVFRRLLGWLSFGCLVAGLGSFFPPWRLHAVGFWAVVLVGSVAPPSLLQLRRASWNGSLFIALFAATIAASYLSIALGVGMFLALIATGIGYAHLLVLVPAFAKWIDLKTDPPPDVERGTERADGKRRTERATHDPDCVRRKSAVLPGMRQSGAKPKRPGVRSPSFHQPRQHRAPNWRT